MSASLNWEREGQIWPHRSASQFVEVGPLAWHVQRMSPDQTSGPGNARAKATSKTPKVLLLHGTGASVHSWHRLMPVLAERCCVLAPDLPGHGFTKGRPDGGLTLDGIVDAIETLLTRADFQPDLVVGHSAGVAIALALSIKQAMANALDVPIVGLNPAIMPFRGPAAQVFPAMAKMLLVNPFAPRIFARMAKVPGEAARFLKRSTGSQTDAVSEACYAALFSNRHHARGALEMMANWDLEALKRHLPSLSNPVLLMHSDRDRAIPRSSVDAAVRLLPHAKLEMVSNAGHLAHEEQAEEFAARIIAFAREQGVLGQGLAQASA
jgi:magnesium chelatase accessory protein